MKQRTLSHFSMFVTKYSTVLQGPAVSDILDGGLLSSDKIKEFVADDIG